MIICGFAGIGKSTLAKKVNGVVDLESTPFNKDWNKYIDVAEHMDRQGYTVLLSCHKELREKLQERNIQYICVLPNKELKDEYMKRYSDRASGLDFIEKMYEYWDFYCNSLENESIVILQSGEYLADIFKKPEYIEQKYLALMKSIGKGPSEWGHIEADDYLCELLKELGYKNVVEAYKKNRKMVCIGDKHVSRLYKSFNC